VLSGSADLSLMLLVNPFLSKNDKEIDRNHSFESQPAVRFNSRSITNFLSSMSSGPNSSLDVSVEYSVQIKLKQSRQLTEPIELSSKPIESFSQHVIPSDQIEVCLNPPIHVKGRRFSKERSVVGCGNHVHVLRDPNYQFVIYHTH
jgi:hypothetical protein